eukprot:4272911-Amphidinium_carterae.1
MPREGLKFIGSWVAVLLTICGPVILAHALARLAHWHPPRHLGFLGLRVLGSQGLRVQTLNLLRRAIGL